MKPEGRHLVRDTKRALRKARKEYPGDPAAQEELLKVLGYPRLAEIHAEARREERQRIRACFELAQDRSEPVADWLKRRALSEDRPSPDELARELVRARASGELPVVVQGW